MRFARTTNYFNSDIQIRNSRECDAFWATAINQPNFPIILVKAPARVIWVKRLSQ